MEIKYNDTFSTSHSSDDVFDFIERDTTLLNEPRNEATLFPRPTEVSLNETLYSGYKPQNIQLAEPENSLIKGSNIQIKPILLSDPDVNAQAAFAKSHTRDFYKGRSFRYAGQWEEGVHYINDEYITDFVVKDGVFLVCKKSNMSSWSNEPTEWVYEGDLIIAVISDYWEVILAGGLRGKTYLPEYDEASDSLVWRLIEPEELPQQLQIGLQIRDYIDYSLVPIQEDIIDVKSDVDITKQSISSLQGDVINLDNNLTTLEVITGRISTDMAELEGNFNDFVHDYIQTSEGLFYRVGDLENNVGQLWLTSREFGVQMENAEGDIARLTIHADQISTRVENAEGDISQINQRADEISTQVENQQGDISRISQRADQIQTAVENQQGDISRITQRADIIESQVQNLDGDVSTISQRADQIQSQVQNIEGDVSTITQRADLIETQVQNQEGDISRISQTASEIQSEVENINGDISRITQTADQIHSEVQNINGDISTITQRADLIESQVQNQAGEISRISQTAEQIQTEVENLNGDVSTITQRADLIESSVSNLEGDVSTLSQTANEISARVTNTEGDISVISQRADEISSAVSNMEGDISIISQRADEIQSTVEDAEGSISQVTQHADLIEQTVRSNKQDLDGALLEMESKIRQTATEIYSEVSSNKLELDNKITSTNSRITQQAGLIEQKVSQAEYDTRTGQIEQSISAVDQKADTISQSVEHVSGNIDRTAQALSNYILQTDEVLEILLNQADGAIDTWFYEGVPTLNNLPASGWTTDSNKEEHLGDLYYDKLTGSAYRFIKDNNTYCWSAVTDNSLAEALALAAEAKDTADGKRRVFVREPVPPYDEGDLWVQGHIASGNNANNGMIYVCINSRATGIFVDSDWAIAFDLVTIKKAKSSFELFADAIEGRVWQEDGNGIITGNTYSRVKQTVDTINLHIENTKSALRATGIDIYGVQFDEYGVPINGGTVVITADNFKIQANNSDVQDAISITLVDGHPKISASSLEVEGIFSNTPGSIWLSKVGALNTTAQGYATSALNSAKSYADNTALNAISTAESYVQTLLWGNGTAQDPASGTILKRLNEIIDLGGSLDTAVNNMEDTVTTMGTTVSGMSYLTQALLNGSTASIGGLLLSSLIQLGYNNNGNWTIWSGINGVYNNNPNINPDASAQDAVGYGNGIAAWYGGQMADRFYNVHNATSTAAKALFRMDGSGYLAKKNIKWEADGSGSLAGDNITWDANGKLTVKGGVLTTELKAGYELYDNWVVMSGISGDYDNIISDPSAQDVPLGHGIAAWFGGDRLDKEITENIDNPTAATTVFRFDGSGYLADGAISWGPSGSLHLGDSVLFGDSDTTASQILANVLRLASYFTDETITLDGVERHILRINTDGQEQNSSGFIGVAWDGLLLTSGDQIVGDTMDLQGLPKEDIRHVIMSQDEWDSFENPDPGVIYMIYE